VAIGGQRNSRIGPLASRAAVTRSLTAFRHVIFAMPATGLQDCAVSAAE
jgi:hypothetical protein